MYQNPMKMHYKVQMHLLFRQRAVSHSRVPCSRGQAQPGRGRPGTLTLGTAFGTAWAATVPCPEHLSWDRRSVTLAAVFCLPYLHHQVRPLGHPPWQDSKQSRGSAPPRLLSAGTARPRSTALSPAAGGVLRPQQHCGRVPRLLRAWSPAWCCSVSVDSE